MPGFQSGKLKGWRGGVPFTIPAADVWHALWAVDPAEGERFAAWFGLGARHGEAGTNYTRGDLRVIVDPASSSVRPLDEDTEIEPTRMENL